MVSRGLLSWARKEVEGRVIGGRWRRVQAGVPTRSEGGSKEITEGTLLWSESQRLESIQTVGEGAVGRKS